MDRVEAASRSERQAVLEWLEGRGLVENAWLMWDVSPTGLNRKVLVCRRDGEIAGVASVLTVDDTWYKKPNYDYQVGLDAVDDTATASILQACPEGVGEFLPTRDDLQPFFAALPGVNERRGDLYYTVSGEDFKPVARGDILELTEADAALFQGSGQAPNWESSDSESRLLAIVRDGRAASSVRVMQIGDRAPSGQAVRSVGALYTETVHRRQGLARRLVCFATELILRDGDVPMYWTEPDNIASQGLCLGLGYRQYWQRVRSCVRTDSSRVSLDLPRG